MRTLFDRGNLDTWVPVIHGRAAHRPGDATKRDARKTWQWKSVISSPAAGGPLSESGFEQFPALVPRWAASRRRHLRQQRA